LVKLKKNSSGQSKQHWMQAVKLSWQYKLQKW
jgi:hypothetical protein